MGAKPSKQTRGKIKNQSNKTEQVVIKTVDTRETVDASKRNEESKQNN